MLCEYTDETSCSEAGRFCSNFQVKLNALDYIEDTAEKKQYRIITDSMSLVQSLRKLGMQKQWKTIREKNTWDALVPSEWNLETKPI